jgi:hypothetical protein
MFHWSDPDEEGMAASASQSSDGNPQGYVSIVPSLFLFLNHA